MSDVATEGTAGPSFELGSVNVDSLKEVLDMLGGIYPFQDETSKLAYHEQVASISEAGNPHEDSSAAGGAEIADLESQVAALQAQLAAAQASETAPPPSS